MRLDPHEIEQLGEAIRPVIREEVSEAFDSKVGDLIPSPWLSRSHLADHLGVSEHVVRDAETRGEISGVRIGRQSRYNLAEAERSLRNGSHN